VRGYARPRAAASFAIAPMETTRTTPNNNFTNPDIPNPFSFPSLPRSDDFTIMIMYRFAKQLGVPGTGPYFHSWFGSL
jgi:hypothetical protein